MAGSFDLLDLVAGMHECFLTVEPFTAVRLLVGEPDSVQAPPIIYTMLDRIPRRIAHGNQMQQEIRFMNRCCIPFQDRKVSEEMALRLSVELPESIEVDDRLGNRISMGQALCEEVITGFSYINGTMFRVLDLYVQITYKRPHLAANRAR